nr:MAG TPA_asm: hypothetical protein [Caudoviricetes sp.]
MNERRNNHYHSSGACRGGIRPDWVVGRQES